MGGSLVTMGGNSSETMGGDSVSPFLVLRDASAELGVPAQLVVAH